METYGLSDNDVRPNPITNRYELQKHNSQEVIKPNLNRFEQAAGIANTCFNLKELPSPKDQEGSLNSTRKDGSSSCNTLKITHSSLGATGNKSMQSFHESRLNKNKKTPTWSDSTMTKITDKKRTSLTLATSK